ncbi:uncharacterized protein LOC100678697 [Nasonia vitripennis]|uniref:THAP-type domain-containing protein n=1 Tax=Nasonia vitripennis TaxID=7425 RepID=A0A7M7GDU9_NASVI|nr:uncharacterized protein LOC100678697 [Nasonia vitripennis]
MSSAMKKKCSLRRCTVFDCRSGTYSDRRVKTETGLRQTTIFTPPINKPELLKKWSKILNKELTEKDRVCELHFAEHYVIKSDHTKLPDGTVFSLPRIKYRLTPDAVPYNPNNPTEVETYEQGKEIQIADGAADQTKDGFLVDHQYFIDARKPDQYVYYNKEVAACFMIPSIKDALVKKKEVSETSDANDNDEITIYGTDDTIKDTNDSTNSNIIDDTNSNIIDDTNNSMNNTIDGTNNGTDDTIDDPNDDSNFEVMEFEEVFNVDKIEKQKLKIQEVKDYLVENPLQRTWSWMNYTKKDNGITFAQLDCRSRKIRCFVEVHEDLSITLHTGDDKVSLEIEFELTSIQSISKMLQTVVKMKICSGTALEKESRSEDCTGIIIPEEEYKCARSLDRCIACRKLRIRVMHSRDTRDVNVKYLNLKKQYEQLRRKSRYLEEKLDIKTTRLKAITEMIKSVNKYGKNYETEL